LVVDDAGRLYFQEINQEETPSKSRNKSFGRNPATAKRGYRCGGGVNSKPYISLEKMVTERNFVIITMKVSILKLECTIGDDGLQVLLPALRLQPLQHVSLLQPQLKILALYLNYRLSASLMCVPQG
jgi:hypothetical protein